MPAWCRSIRVRAGLVPLNKFSAGLVPLNKLDAGLVPLNTLGAGLRSVVPARFPCHGILSPNESPKLRWHPDNA